MSRTFQFCRLLAVHGRRGSPLGNPVLWCDLENYPWKLSRVYFSNHCLDPIINTILLNWFGIVSLLCNWTMTDKFLKFFFLILC